MRFRFRTTLKSGDAPEWLDVALGGVGDILYIECWVGCGYPKGTRCQQEAAQRLRLGFAVMPDVFEGTVGIECWPEEIMCRVDIPIGKMSLTLPSKCPVPLGRNSQCARMAACESELART